MSQKENPPHKCATGVPGVKGLVLLNDFDSSTGAADHREQCRSIGGVQADATVRCRATKTANRIRSVNGIAAMEEHGIWHRRIVVFARMPHLVHAVRLPTSSWCTIALSSRGNLKSVNLNAVYENVHALVGNINLRNDITNVCMCCLSSDSY